MDAIMTPDLSPAMLQFFIQARCRHAVASGMARDIKVAKSALRKAAGVTSAAFDTAWSGRLNKASPRLKLWGTLGVVPGNYGVVLTDDGGHRCQTCGSTERLQVHHRTYLRRGREMSRDLMVLCEPCHKLFHENSRLSDGGRADV